MKTGIMLGLTMMAFYARYSQNVDAAITQIDHEVADINRSKHEIKAYPYRNTCGVIAASVSLCFCNDDLVKITDKGRGDDDKAAGKWHYQYYYKNGLLIFSSRLITFFNQETGKEASSDIREYYAANRLLKKTEDQATTYPSRIMIDDNDTRYRLRTIKKAADVQAIYKCPE